MRKILLITTLFLFVANATYAQSGYFGSRYSIDAQFNLGPSIKRSSGIKKSNGENILSKRLRIINPSYRLGFSFIASKKIEVGIAYEYARMHSYSEDIRIIPDPDYFDGSSSSILGLKLMDDVVFNKNGFSLKTLIYIRGSKAPIGKYFGFSTNFGRVSTPKSTIRYGLRGPTTTQSNFYSRKNEIDTLITEPIRLLTTTGYYFNFRGTLGRNYPLTKKLMFNIAFSFPIINILFDGNGNLPTLGAFYVFDPFEDSDIFDLFEDDVIRLDEGDINDVLLYTTHKYNRVQFDIGIKYNL